MAAYRLIWSHFGNEGRLEWGRDQTRESFSATCSHVHNQARWHGDGLQPALKLVDDDDTPGERQGLETTVEQALMRGLVTA